MKRVKIGGGQGFWGDSNDAAIHMINNSDIDYMACDYLAELTLSIMARQKLKNPKAGYARDFLSMMEECGETAIDKDMKVLTNAGGMNVNAMVDALAELFDRKNKKGVKIGYVLGDEISDQIPDLIAQGIGFDNIDGTGSFAEIQDKIFNANVYFGHEPTMHCLEQGADIVITGRSTDSALFLAPIMHEMKWKKDDWDHIARGIMAGHLLECGGQGSGGNFDYDWRSVPEMDNLGFPIAEISDSELVITKAPDCGGLISEQVCKEQLLYEIHDPANYITPDVIADISSCRVNEIAKNRVSIENIKGKAKGDLLKVSMGYHSGYRVSVMLSFAWPDAYEKAQYAAEILKKKMKRKDIAYEEIQIDYIGLNSLHLGVAEITDEMLANQNEVVMRLAIRTKTKEAAQKLAIEVAPLQLNGPPGASFFGGRAKIQEVIGLWPTLIPRDAVKLSSHIRTV